MQTLVSPALSVSVFVCNHTCSVRDPLIRVLTEISLAITAAHEETRPTTRSPSVCDAVTPVKSCICFKYWRERALYGFKHAVQQQRPSSVSVKRESLILTSIIWVWCWCLYNSRRDAITSSLWDICFYSSAMNHLACVLCNFKALPFMEMHQSLLKAFSS